MQPEHGNPTLCFTRDIARPHLKVLGFEPTNTFGGSLHDVGENIALAVKAELKKRNFPVEEPGMGVHDVVTDNGSNVLVRPSTTACMHELVANRLCSTSQVVPTVPYVSIGSMASV